MVEIAIVGISAALPGAKNINQFWNNLIEGKCSIIDTSSYTKLSKERCNQNEYYVKGYLECALDCDYEFFKIPKHDALIMDPQFKVLLENVYLALEDAGVDSDHFENISLYASASSLNSNLHNNILRTKNTVRSNIINYKEMYLNNIDFLAQYISYKLNLKGAATNINTACSSSAVSFVHACESLKNRQSDIAISASVSITIPTFWGYRYEEDGIFSKRGECRPFDKDADGTIPGNGSVVFVLKRLEDAINDRNNIYGLVQGYSINNDGLERMGFAAPTIEGQKRNILNALDRACIGPEHVDFAECHGTGTLIGDKVELHVLGKSYRESSTQNNPLYISSVKANIGHLDVASGGAGILKTVLSLKHRVFPRQIAYAKNDNIPPQLVVSSKNISIEKEQFYAGVNSLGVGGTNCHIILKNWKETRRSLGNEYRKRIFIISTKTQSSLSELKHNVLNHLQKIDFDIDDLEYTLLVGRRLYRYFYIVLFDHKEQLFRADLENESNYFFDLKNLDNVFYNLYDEIKHNDKIPTHVKNVFDRKINSDFSENLDKLWRQKDRETKLLALPPRAFDKSNCWQDFCNINTNITQNSLSKSLDHNKKVILETLSEFSTNEVKTDSPIHSLEFDSLDLLQIIDMLNKKLSINLSIQNFISFSKVSDILDEVTSRGRK